jgi:sugar lactone lactonase YvrE
MANGTITGTVTDEGGSPIAGIGVGTGDYDNIVNCEGGDFWAGTEADGTYHLDIPAGTYLVFVNSHGYPGSYVPEAYPEINTWSQITAMVPVTVTAGQVVTGVDFSLPAGFTVSGQLVDEGGQSVLGAGGNIRALYQDIEFGCALGFSSSNTDGTFRVNVPEGTYDLSFCQDSTCHTVLRSRTITESVDLGNVVFAEASEPENPRALEPGYTAEWFVAPGAFNMPQEILLTPDDTILVMAVRSTTLFELGDSGVITPVSTGVLGYQGDIDSGGTVYLHSHPEGIIYRVAPDSTTTVFADDARLFTPCDSGFGFGPDGKLYLALHRCEATSTLFEITLAGAITERVTGIPSLNALHTAADGRFLGADGQMVYALDLTDYSVTEVGSIPTCCISPAGLTSDAAGNIYVATGARQASGTLYRIAPDGATSKVADIADNGISGIEWRASTGEIIGGQLRRGGVLAIKPDGTIRELVSGNGLNSPMGMAFSPEGQLAVANDDGGLMIQVDPQGEAQWFFDYLSFTPPMPFVTYAIDGTLYASEGCPGFAHDVLALSPNESAPSVFTPADWPSGMALTPDSALLVAETVAGRIIRVEMDGITTTVASGLRFPQALAYNTAGELYAVTGVGSTSMLDVFPAPLDGDTIVRITAQGEPVTLTPLANVGALIAGANGTLFAATGRGVVRVETDGTVNPFATGFSHALGLAFDLQGNLYVSDAHRNGIARIAGFPQATLRGMVSSADSGPLPGAQVQILVAQPYVVGKTLTTTTSGSYTQMVAPRPYTVIAWAQGYAPAAQQVTPGDGETLVVNFTLERWRNVYLPLVLRN